MILFSFWSGSALFQIVSYPSNAIKFCSASYPLSAGPQCEAISSHIIYRLQAAAWLLLETNVAVIMALLQVLRTELG